MMVSMQYSSDLYMTMIIALKMTFGITEEKQCLEVRYAIFYATQVYTYTTQYQRTSHKIYAIVHLHKGWSGYPNLTVQIYWYNVCLA